MTYFKSEQSFLISIEFSLLRMSTYFLATRILWYVPLVPYITLLEYWWTLDSLDHWCHFLRIRTNCILTTYRDLSYRYYFFFFYIQYVSYLHQSLSVLFTEWSLLPSFPSYIFTNLDHSYNIIESFLYVYMCINSIIR